MNRRAAETADMEPERAPATPAPTNVSLAPLAQAGLPQEDESRRADLRLSQHTMDTPELVAREDLLGQAAGLETVEAAEALALPSGIRLGSWAGRPNYECAWPECSAAALSLAVALDHLAAHPWPAEETRTGGS